MNISDIPIALTGKPLIDAFNSEVEQRKPLVDGFIYEKTINMMAADPGLGKSTVSAQMAVEMAAGLPVFGTYNMERPAKVLYVQTERPIIELLERLKSLSKVFPIMSENLVITDAYQRFDLLKPDHVHMFIDCVKRDCPDVDFIIIDPIYAIVSGGLKDDIPASAFTKGMSLLQYETGASLWYNHHTVKIQYNAKGYVIEKDDPFYGSQWIKAHITGSFHLVGHKNGVKLIKKKDNYNVLPNNIMLDYEPEAGILHIPHSELSAIDRLRNYIHMRKLDKKEFSFKDIQDDIKLCTRTLRELLMHSSIKGSISVVSSIRNKNLYTVAQAQI